MKNLQEVVVVVVVVLLLLLLHHHHISWSIMLFAIFVNKECPILVIEYTYSSYDNVDAVNNAWLKDLVWWSYWLETDSHQVLMILCAILTYIYLVIITVSNAMKRWLLITQISRTRVSSIDPV